MRWHLNSTTRYTNYFDTCEKLWNNFTVVSNR
jgi:hypothetical protein